MKRIYLSILCILSCASLSAENFEIEADKSQSGNEAVNAFDNDPNTKWAAQGKGRWVQLQLPEAKELSKIEIGFANHDRDYAFDVRTSDDGKNWSEPIEFRSDARKEVFGYEFEKTTAKFIRVTVFGSDANDWANIHTIRIPGVKVPAAAGAKANPVSDLIFTKWSGDLNVPDPVAISLDNQGRAYVTQTQRRKAQDLDIRRFRDWIPNDVGFETVEDKRAFYHDVLAPGKGDKRIADLNEDGSNDYRDLMVLSEKIHLLEDTDGDGIADQSRVFAEDFRTELTGVAGGVLWHNDDVYLTAVPDVYRLHDSDGDGVADEREIIATGFGVHLAYAGHDMHGLTVGPDGKIYWSIGDKGISATSAEGERFHFPNQGGVMRCNPDGSDFEVFAHGLRNVQELAFDEFGNLFGVDNDADRPGEKERFVYIVRGMDAGWRCNYQYRGDGYNPWTEEGIWKPQADFPDRPIYTVPPISNYIDGPCGFAYNPGAALGEEWARTFFLTGAPNGCQFAFQVESRGASFEMVNERKVGQGIAITGLNFGPDGALYGTDWGTTGYPLTQSGGVWKIDVLADQQHPKRAETKALLTLDLGAAKIDDLAKLLGHDDQRVRLKAQFELVRREDVQTFANAAEKGQIHGVWGLGQLGAVQQLQDLAAHEDAEIQAQVGRVAADQEIFDEAILLDLAESENPRVKFFALQAFAEHGSTESQDYIVNQVAENDGKDLYLRQAGIMAMTAIDEASLANLAGSDSIEVQRCAVVALRRLKSASVAEFLGQTEAVAKEAAMAIHDDFSIPQAMPSLAAALSNHENEAFVRRALNANLRLGEVAHAQRVANWATESKHELKLREVAIESLLEWIEPSEFDKVDGRIRKFEPRDSAEVAEAIQESVIQLVQDEVPSIQAGGIRLAKQYAIQLDSAALAIVLKSESTPDDVRLSALEFGSKDIESIKVALDAKSVAVRMRAMNLLVDLDPDFAKKQAEEFTISSQLIERQNAIRAFVELKDTDYLTPLVGALVEGKVEAGLQLEIIEAGQKLGIDERLTEFLARRANIVDPANFGECLEGGSAAAGEAIFRNHIAAQCIRCHKVGDSKDGSEIGPNLVNAREHGREYLLEALIAPQKVVAEGYGNITITLKDGSSVAGQFRSEDKSQIIVRDPATGKETKVAKAEIAEQSQVLSVMPPVGAILKRREIRDVIAYLMTLEEK